MAARGTLCLGVMRRYVSSPPSAPQGGSNAILGGTCLAHLGRARARCERGANLLGQWGFFYQPSRTARPGSGPRAREAR